MKRRLLSGGAWALGGKAVTAFTALATNALLARLLSPGELGAYFLALSAVTFFALLGSLGLERAVVRFVAESLGLDQFHRARRVVGIVCVVGLLGASGVGLAYIFLGRFIGDSLFHAPALTAVTGMVAGWVVVMTLQSLLSETFRGFHDIRLATLFGGLTTGVLLTGSLSLLWLFEGQATLATVILLAAGSGCASALLAGWMLRRVVAALPPGGAEDRINLTGVLQVAWPVLITNLGLFAISQADIWAVGIFRSQEEVAIYGAAARMVILVFMPLLIVNSVVPPLIAQMFAQGRRAELEATLRATATLAGIPAFLMLAVFILFGGPILGLVYGGYYREGATVLALLSLGQLANAWAGSCGITLMMTGHQTTMMVITVVSGIIAGVACAVFASKYGATGAAAAGAAGFVLQNISMWLGTRFTTGMWTHVDFHSVPRLLRALRT